MDNFLEGKTILVDKPFGWTSFDVVKKIRWQIKQKLGLKKIKVGHAGTLDPLATGLLIICTGKHTKKIEEIMPGIKTYTGKFILGKTTPSFDLETAFDQELPIEHITPEAMNIVRTKLIGKLEQFPPVYSAKQIDGKRAYDYAREGKIVELKPSNVEVYSFEVSTECFPEIEFRISCSKGTYIRSLVSDFGKLLHSGATLIELKRIASGGFNIENALEPQEIIERIIAGVSIN